MQNELQNLFPKQSEIPQEFDFKAEIHQRELLIDGEFLRWNGAVQEVFSPVHVETEKGLHPKLLGSFPMATEKEALVALDAAVKAYDNGRGEWPTMTISERISCMENFTNLMIQKKAKIVNLIMWEIGKTYADSVKEFDRTVDYIHDTIDALKETDREASRFVIEGGVIGQIRRAPLGVVLCMGPFNYPLNETYTLLIPALLMGNTVLFKPPKHGSLLHYPLYEAFQKSFPKGVFNTVYGKGHSVIPPLMSSGKVNVLTLIGSRKVADSLKKMHPKVNRLRAILGLDAKNAAIVLPCADLDLAVKECVLGSLSFNGQRCTAIKIIFVHESVANEFCRKFAHEVSKLKPGMPWEKGVQLTPLPEPGKPGFIKEVIDDAQANGASVINEHGGEAFKSFVFPAVLFPVNDKM
ncbi:MAG: aldehyde dehydrogenase family protein, partial [Cytophagales bacterium]